MKLIIGNQNYSSWSLRAWLMLKKLDVDFSTTTIPLMVPGFKEALFEQSPSGKVPVLIDDDLIIWDSLAIGEYLSETYKSLWPKDPKQRAFARSISNQMHSGFFAIRENMPFNCRAKGRSINITTAIQTEVNEVFALLDQCLQKRSDQSWLFGAFSMADAMYIPLLMRFDTYQIEMPESIRGYYQWVLADLDIQQWLLESKNEQWTIDGSEVGE